MKEIVIDDLQLCLTRRCNMTCRHCLRGDAQAKDMSTEIIDKVFLGLKDARINNLLLTGGELTVIPPKTLKRQLDAILYHCRTNNIQVYNLAFISNGKKVSQKFSDIMTEFSNKLNIASIYIGISETQYHEIDDFDDRYMLHALHARIKQVRHISPKEEESYLEVRHDIDDCAIIIDGRAEEDLQYCIDQNKNRTAKSIYDNSTLYVREYDNEIRFEGYVYIGTTGNVLSDCDYSYESEEKYKLLNLNNMNGKYTATPGLFDILYQEARFGNNNKFSYKTEDEM